MEYKECIMKGFEGLYRIYENGDIYSIKKQCMINQWLNGIYPYAYKYVKITGHSKGDKYLGPAHIITALHWIGPKPSPQYGVFDYEINHKDLNKQNNHWTNLEWATHRENILHARRESPWKSGRKAGFTQSEDTRLLMAKAKWRKVLLFNENESIVCKSVIEAMGKLGVYRRMFNRYVGTNRKLNGYKMKFL